MDMKTNMGSFAAALKDKDVWVMNVVPEDGPNTLKLIYDRGLIGTVHDWYAYWFLLNYYLKINCILINTLFWFIMDLTFMIIILNNLVFLDRTLSPIYALARLGE
jgi:hypothetical protein